jgi:Recombinase zinc beta ribbon domain
MQEASQWVFVPRRYHDPQIGRDPRAPVGLLRCRPCGCAMTPTHATKGGKRYRYYVCSSALRQGRECPAPTSRPAWVDSAQTVGKFYDNGNANLVYHPHDLRNSEEDPWHVASQLLPLSYDDPPTPTAQMLTQERFSQSSTNGICISTP